ncbi:MULTISPECIES: A24 family peptidase [Comamonas]|uniref:A24 family peptidase n=1 Tax=Comamonas TaxID=283 RepID=UPI0009B90834|nr:MULTISPECIES: prepilin peptidase [Comamonas]UNV93160.1 prepilin peptidase [Comamonas sp. 7D-2evo1]UNV98156.1 prepilin peptidase [Comamonas sp. 7D-2]UNW02795.1 prepilin peptidase [Comamonas sp. 7D-2evo2]
MILFLLWLCFSGVDDFRNRKARNLVVIFGLFLAFAASAMGPEIHPLGVSFGESLISALVCFFVFFIFYFFRKMGAGDVKFGMALGAFIGFNFLLPVWALSCSFALIHGIFSKWRYFVLIFLGGSLDFPKRNDKFIPYVTYLSIATVIVLMISK